jgi:hypothetical protein
MSAWGQKQTFRSPIDISALTPKVDSSSTDRASTAQGVSCGPLSWPFSSPVSVEFGYARQLLGEA